MGSRFVVVVGTVIVATVGLSARGAADNSDAERVRLVDRAAEPWSAINRWLIEYEATPSAATAATTEGVPVHRIMAVAAPGEFYHLSAHFPPIHPWQADPFCQEYFISQGKTCHRWPFNRTYSEGRRKTGDAIGGTIGSDVLLTVIPRWPLTNYRTLIDASSGTPIIAIDALRSADYRRLSDAERIAGEDCAVFDRKGLDRIWVALKKGICVMRRDTRDARSGRLAQRILADKVEQVAPGLWLPTQFRSQFFSVKQGASEDTVGREYGVHILRCLLNDDVSMSVFTPIHRPGSLRYENATQFAQVSPGGEDLLSDLVDFMVQYASLPTAPAPNDHPSAWFLGGLAGGLCVGLFFFVVPARFARQKGK
jgi:hypothetical protein